VDEAHYRRALDMIDRSISFLRSAQDPETGGWAVSPQGPQFPAITGLVVTGMLMQPDIDADDEQVRRGVDFMLSFRQDSGGIYDRVLASYNTSICLSALARVERADAAAAIKPAQVFLGRLQWSGAALDHPETREVGEDHPFYGGVGYGRSGRPDLSNTSLMLQGLHDSGLAADEEAFYRAVKFLERLQMSDAINDQPYADGSSQGGFIYAPGTSQETAGQGESKAGEIVETMDDGTRVSRLRAYGSMTYAGFKSYVYADLPRDDPRVVLAYDWIRKHYDLSENPGLGEEGLYYYFVTFSRALDAWGLPTITRLNPDGSEGATRDWANDLIDRLAELQNEDGSFRSVNDRWMEDNPVLITAYALLALQHAVR
jgi:squalene-hopene/tetraprenyl-beta-curcumene cyclase